jgi:hypothetical protein
MFKLVVRVDTMDGFTAFESVWDDKRRTVLDINLRRKVVRGVDNL